MGGGRCAQGKTYHYKVDFLFIVWTIRSMGTYLQKNRSNGATNTSRQIITEDKNELTV